MCLTRRQSPALTRPVAPPPRPGPSPQSPSTRRSVLRDASAALLTFGIAGKSNAYTLPDLPYPYDALEPYIDAPTMKFHHDKHHQTYLTNINAALPDSQPDLVDLQANALDVRAVRNSGGGHYNHAFFWDEMEAPGKAAKTKPGPALSKAIEEAFGGLDQMKEKFEAAAAPGAVFGSGWVWVAVNGAGKLEIVGTPNQDNPLMKGALDEVKLPILGLDVWEHAYYLNYQNRRPDYVKAFWNVVNWDKINDNYDYVMKNHRGVPVRG